MSNLTIISTLYRYLFLCYLRTSLPNGRAASDFDVVMAAIQYIESLQHQVVFLNKKEQKQDKVADTSSPDEEKVEKNNN